MVLKIDPRKNISDMSALFYRRLYSIVQPRNPVNYLKKHLPDSIILHNTTKHPQVKIMSPEIHTQHIIERTRFGVVKHFITPSTLATIHDPGHVRTHTFWLNDIWCDDHYIFPNSIDVCDTFQDDVRELNLVVRESEGVHRPIRYLDNEGFETDKQFYYWENMNYCTYRMFNLNTYRYIQFAIECESGLSSQALAHSVKPE